MPVLSSPRLLYGTEKEVSMVYRLNSWMRHRTRMRRLQEPTDRTRQSTLDDSTTGLPQRRDLLVDKLSFSFMLPQYFYLPLYHIRCCSQTHGDGTTSQPQWWRLFSCLHLLDVIIQLLCQRQDDCVSGSADLDCLPHQSDSLLCVSRVERKRFGRQAPRHFAVDPGVLVRVCCCGQPVRA